MTAEHSQKRILIAEDEAIIAMDLEAQIADMGHAVLGPFATVAAALAAIDNEPPHAALLDFSLAADETSEAIARRLAAEAIPFALVTGYAPVELRPDSPYSDRPVLAKPSTKENLQALVAELLAETGA